MEKLINSIIDFLKILVVTPILILVIILVIPLAIAGLVFIQYERVRDKIKLRILIRKNEGKTFFIYSDYNNLDLSQLKLDFNELHCIKVRDNRVNGVLEQYLIRGLYSKSYPRLVKIHQGTLIHKEHYNSFKKLVKRNNDLDSFLELLTKSFNNLNKHTN